ncbi:hypothetical protein FQN49_005816, partial [Arthroderma sp. PD_2]
MPPRIYTKKEEWRWIRRQLDKRAGKRSVVLRDGVPLTEKQLKKGIGRHPLSTFEEKCQQYQGTHVLQDIPSPDTPQRIQIQTPITQEASTPVFLPLDEVLRSPINQQQQQQEYPIIPPATPDFPSMDWQISDEVFLSEFINFSALNSASEGQATVTSETNMAKRHERPEIPDTFKDVEFAFRLLLYGGLECFQTPILPIPDVQQLQDLPTPDIQQVQDLEREIRSHLALITSCLQLGHEEAGQTILSDLLKKIGADHGRGWIEFRDDILAKHDSKTGDEILHIFRQRLADFEILLGHKNETLLNMHTFMSLIYLIPETLIPPGARGSILSRLSDGAQFLLRPLTEGVGAETAQALLDSRWDIVTVYEGRDFAESPLGKLILAATQKPFLMVACAGLMAYYRLTADWEFTFELHQIKEFNDVALFERMRQLDLRKIFLSEEDFNAEVRNLPPVSFLHPLFPKLLLDIIHHGVDAGGIAGGQGVLCPMTRARRAVDELLQLATVDDAFAAARGGRRRARARARATVVEGRDGVTMWFLDRRTEGKGGLLPVVGSTRL